MPAEVLKQDELTQAFCFAAIEHELQRENRRDVEFLKGIASMFSSKK